MSRTARPYRSVLYVPGSHARALEKAKSLPVDAIIFDLEDAVTPDEKANARQRLVAGLQAGTYGARACLVRVNGLDSEWGHADLQAISGARIDGIVIPKVDGAGDVDAVARLCPDVPVWAMVETPLGVLNAAAICAHPRLAGLVMGTNDLAKELHCHPGQGRQPLMVALQTCLLAARAAGVICVDGVYNAYQDDDGLALECGQGRDLGFDGKTLIHPAQIATANRVFSPSADEAELAHRQIAAFEAAHAEGKGVAVVDGRIVENLHIDTARATLARMDAIAAMEG